MGTGRIAATALLALGLAACGGGGPATPSPTATPSATATPSPTATASVTATTTASPAPTGSPAPTCEAFGSVADQQSADPLAMSSLTGRAVRVGRHPCYERFVFEMTGSGDRPGWSVGYRDPLLADPAGFVVDLRGDASLEVVVRVWTVTDFEGRPPQWPPFESPTTIVTSGFESLLEVEYISAFEGTTQFGLGIDRERPFRAFWLDDPPRLVVDIATAPSG